MAAEKPNKNPNVYVNTSPSMVFMNTKSQIEANKQFFLSVLKSLNENGEYVWIDYNEKFIKKENKLHGTKKGIQKVLNITNKSFIDKYFATM